MLCFFLNPCLHQSGSKYPGTSLIRRTAVFRRCIIVSGTSHTSERCVSHMPLVQLETERPMERYGPGIGLLSGIDHQDPSLSGSTSVLAQLKSSSARVYDEPSESSNAVY